MCCSKQVLFTQCGQRVGHQLTNVLIHQEKKKKENPLRSLFPSLCYSCPDKHIPRASFCLCSHHAEGAPFTLGPSSGVGSHPSKLCTVFLESRGWEGALNIQVYSSAMPRVTTNPIARAGKAPVSLCRCLLTTKAEVLRAGM